MAADAVRRKLARQSLLQRPAALAIHRDGREVTARAAADFLALEIQTDVMAREIEIADAIYDCIMAHRENARILAEDALLKDLHHVIDRSAKASCQTLYISDWARSRREGDTRLPARAVGSQEQYRRDQRAKKRKAKR